MSDLYLVHMSDLHFSGDYKNLQPDDALKLAGEALAEQFEDEQLVLSISGDITTKGDRAGYHEALASIQKHLQDELKIDKIVVCPGNHDIVDKDRSFGDFNKFAYALTNDYTQSWNPENPVCTVEFGEYSFVLVNSAYLGDYRVGSVPLAPLEQALKAAREKHPIVLIHHSPISSAYGGAGLAQAYELLALAAKEKVVAVLHGHVHSDQVLTIGSRPTLVSGAASLAFSPDPNMNNQFSVYSFHHGSLEKASTFTYTANRNKFIPMEMTLQ